MTVSTESARSSSMKCLILVGGYGTRLRPLTLSVPKPLIHFCNKSIVEHQIAAAVKAGVNHVILAVGYQPKEMLDALGHLEKKYGIKITCSIEEEPLGTAGPVHLARDILLEDDEPFFVFNSDVICDFPLSQLLDFHKKHGKEGTICVTKVSEPSKFGVVVHDESCGVISAFVEKPKEFVGDRINAGIYVFNKSLVGKRLQPVPMMFETDVFPEMVKDKELFCFALGGYWADIGQPRDYLQGMHLHLQSLSRKRKAGQIDEHLFSSQPGIEIVGNVLVDPSATIGEGSVLGPDVTVGPDCTIGKGVRIKNSALMDNVKVGDNSLISGSIIGWKSKVGRWCRIDKMSVVGEDVKIRDECFINGAFLLPHKEIKDDVREEGKVVM